MKELKVYVVGPSVGYSRWMAERIILVDKIKDAQVVLFTGGEDVYPLLYGEPSGSHTYYGNVIPKFGMPARDHIEQLAYNEALALSKPMFGVCRGIQLLTALNGGKLVQHVTNHAGSDHNLVWADGDITDTTSLHHQMCSPFNLPAEDYQILAVSEQRRSRCYLDGGDNEMDMPVEPEVIYYPKTKCLGIQGHPEMYSSFDTPLHDKLRGLITKLLLVNETETANN
jgi:gamma-glutamyl-gamma-aminobutyrate hydrolase PuuD